MRFQMIHCLAFVTLLSISCIAQGGEDMVVAFGSGRASLALDRLAADRLPPIAPDDSAEYHALVDLRTAVDDFRDIFQRITGQSMPTTDDQDTLPLQLRIDATMSMARNDCRIVVDGRTGVEIVATSRRGLMNGLYTILDDWGCRWVMPGEIGEVLPRARSLALPVGTRDVAIAFDMRTHYNFRGDAPPIREWLRRNRAADDYWLSGQHYWSYAIPPEKYFDEHPEYFALVGDQRVPDQLCTTNPQVIQLMTAVAKEFLRSRPTAATFPMDPNDNLNLCQCDSCRAIDPPGRSQGQPQLTDRVLHFANIIAERIEDEFPDRGVAFYAYTTHINAPVHVRPHKNVHVIITRSNHCLLHLVPNSICTGNAGPAAFEQLIADWRALTPNVYVYEYNPIAWTGHLPCPLYLEFAEAIQRQHAMGVRARQVDGAYPASGSNFLSHYMVVRFLVNAEFEPASELSAICRDFFGPAGDAMERFYVTMARATEQPHPGHPSVGFGIERYEQLFTPQIIAESRIALDDAKRLAHGSTIEGERVAMVDACQQYLEAYLAGVWAAQDRRYEDAVVAFDRVTAILDQLAPTGYLPDIADARRRTNTGRLKAIAQYCPDEMGMRRRWFVLGPFDNANAAAIYETLDWESIPRFDPSSPVVMPNGLSARWHAVESPSGFFSFHRTFEIDAANNTLHYAYAMLPIRVDKATTAQLRFDSFHGIRVSLNGAQVYERTGLDADAPDKRIVPVNIPAGRSVILIKVSQSAIGSFSPWGFYFRITDTHGHPLRNIVDAF